jgi:hypothetical protein
MQDNQDKEKSTDEVQSTREKQNSCWERGCLSVVSIVCCQVKFSATGRSLVQSSPIDCGVSLCVISKPQD